MAEEGSMISRQKLLASVICAASILALVLPAAAQSGTPFPPAFFAVSAVGSEHPKVTIGTLAHQEFAWARIEQSRGTFDFTLFDGYLAAAQANGLVDAATSTANMAITL